MTASRLRRVGTLEAVATCRVASFPITMACPVVISRALDARTAFFIAKVEEHSALGESRTIEGSANERGGDLMLLFRCEGTTDVGHLVSEPQTWHHMKAPESGKMRCGSCDSSCCRAKPQFRSEH